MLHHHDPKVASAFVAGVLPALRQAIKGAGESLAIEFSDGEKVNIRHRTQAQQALMFLLADFLLDSINTHDEDHLYPPLSPAELADQDYARQWVEDLTDEPIYTVADLNAAIDEDEAEQVRQNSPQGTPAPVRTAYQVNRDTALTEESIAEGVIYPFVKKQLDEISAALAPSYAPINVVEDKAEYDLAAGTLAARRAVLISFLSWLQQDPALGGDEIAILEL